ncbi:MAG TPA: ABC transporter ATP-binding protein [Chloroflexota bacterium]|nr:ABC transporter ATP-binding protein [Chloroflexota bacterium]
MSDAIAVSIRNLGHRYGRSTALDHVSFDVPEGSIFGLIGPNGAGKTTTLRVICTLLLPSDGDVTVLGQSVRTSPLTIRRQLGYMPDTFGLYGELRVWEYLDFYARCYDMAADLRVAAIRDALELVDLSPRRDAYVHGLSRGMVQRLALARTLLHDPAILVLDEPSAGLDPRARIELRELLRELQSLGKTILLSSHILADLAEVCSHVAILERGRLAVHGRLDEVLGRVSGGRTVILEVLAPLLATDAATLVPELYALTVTTAGERTVVQGQFRDDDRALTGMLARLVTAGVPVVSLREQKTGLEEVFMQHTDPLSA